MGGSVGGSFSKSKNRSGFEQNVFGPQSDALGSLYGAANDLWSGIQGTAQNQFEQGAQNNQQIMNQMQPAFQSQLQGGAYRNMGLQNQFLSELQQSDRKSTRLNSSHTDISRMPSSA